MSDNLLRDAFERRWGSLVRRSKKRGVPLPDKESLWEKVLAKYRGDWQCPYCKHSLMIKDSKPPYFWSFSIDHKKSFFVYGNNLLENLEIICHRCNIIKSTMEHDTFMALWKILPRDIIEKLYNEIWAGRIAAKLGREENLANSDSE